MKRVSAEIETEFVWNKSRLQRARQWSERGFWERSGRRVRHGTLNGSPKLVPQIDAEARALQKLVRWPNMKIVHVTWSREISSLKHSASMWYLEGHHGAQVSSFCIRAERGDRLSAISNWKKSVEDFLALPLLEDSFLAEELVLSPGALGCLVHESLGHALEEKSGEKILKGLKTKFRVWDEAGDPSQVGHTPWDDFGKRAPSLLIHDGKAGQSKSFFEKAGHQRAVDFHWHPITRQRCLRVEALEVSDAPRTTQLLVDEVQLGSWNPATGISEITTSRATFVDKRSARFRLPPLRLSFEASVLSELRPFGKPELYEPAGGCHKELQRGLPVSVTAPSARVKFSRIQKIFHVAAI